MKIVKQLLDRGLATGVATELNQEGKAYPARVLADIDESGMLHPRPGTELVDVANAENNQASGK